MGVVALWPHWAAWRRSVACRVWPCAIRPQIGIAVATRTLRVMKCEHIPIAILRCTHTLAPIANSSATRTAKKAVCIRWQLSHRLCVQSVNGWFKALYRMLGNAVCPPLIAALCGAILDRVCCDGPTQPRALIGACDSQRPEICGPHCWESIGLAVAVRLAFEAIPADRRAAVVRRVAQASAQRASADQTVLLRKDPVDSFR